MTHTTLAYRQQRGPVVTVADGALNIDGDFIVTNYPGPAACIQAAIDSVKSTGGTVYIRAGRYLLEEEIQIYGLANGLTVTGDGDATVIVQPEVYRPLFGAGNVGMNTVFVTPAVNSITFTMDSTGNFLFAPIRGDVLYVPATSGFALANRGAFTVESYAPAASGPMSQGGWSPSTTPTVRQWNDVAFGKGPGIPNGLFVAVGHSGSIMTSQDGSSWSYQVIGSAHNFQAVCWSPTLGKFLAIEGDNQRTYSSSNGITWTREGDFTDHHNWMDVCWATPTALMPGGMFCAVGKNNSGNRVNISTTGTSWTNVSVSRELTSVCWSPTLELFCAVANGSPAAGQVLTSPDGVNWTPQTAAANLSWTSVCWSEDLGLFCAVASNASGGQQVMTSANGTLWTLRTPASVRQWTSVCWSPELAKFIAVAQDGTTGDQIMESANGTLWTSQTSPSARQWNSVCWGSGANVNGMFCAVADDGTTSSQVMKSSLLPAFSSGASVTVNKRVSTGGGGALEGPIFVGAVGDLSIVGSALRLTATHDVTIEKMRFERTSGANSFGSFVFADSCTANIAVQGNHFVDSDAYFGHDVVFYGTNTWGYAQGNRVLGNRFTGDADNANGASDGVRIFQSQHDLKVNDNWFRSAARSSYIILASPEANTLQHGWNVDVSGNFIDSLVTPAALYSSSSLNGIAIDGWWDSVICDRNRIRGTVSKSNVAFRAIYGSGIGNVGVLSLNHQFTGNDIAVFRTAGSSNAADRCFFFDYSGNTGPCCKVKLSDNNAEYAMGGPYTTPTATLNSFFRQINDLLIINCRFMHAATDCVQIRNGDSLTFTGNQIYMTTVGNAALVFETWNNAVVSGNVINSVRNFGVYITGGSGFVVTGNLINCATAPVVCNGTVSNSTIGPNQGQHEAALQSGQIATGYNVNKQIVKAWAKTSQAGGITAGYNLACSRGTSPAAGVYYYTMSRPMANNDFVILVSCDKAFDYNITALNGYSATQFSIRTWNEGSPAVALDCGHWVIVCGESS